MEPVPFSSLIQELHQHPQSMSSSSLSCALCGTPVARLPSTPIPRTYSPNGNSWFKYPLALGSTQNNNSPPSSTDCEPPEQVYIFRLAASTTPAPPPSILPTHASSVSMHAVGTSSRPLNAISLQSSRVIQAQTHNSPYPLCTSNYCLTRLRSTCSLWAFVRVGIVERIWEEEVVQPSKPLVNGDPQATPSPPTSADTGNQPPNGTTVPSGSEKPPVPPRRRRLWEMASALGERAASWGKESGENTKEKEKDSTKKMPPPPPSHPSAPHPHAEPLASRADVQEPPPLPKRNAVRGKASAEAVVPPPSAQNQNATPENKEPDANVNGHTDSEKAAPSASDSPVDEITFATPPSEASTLPTSDPVSAETSAPPTQDQAPPPSPHTVPLPATPTSPTPTARASSPAPRPRSRLSASAMPLPPSSRPTSPALNRSRTGSPAPVRIARATSPSPGHAPSASQIRGKISSSPLAPSPRPASPAPATGPAAPPIPRRAPARRVVPPPPPTSASGLKAAADGGKEEVGAPVASTTTATADPVPEANVCKASEGGIAPEIRSSDAAGEGRAGVDVDEATASQAAPVTAPATEAEPEPTKDVAVDGVEGVVSGTSATVVSDPHHTPSSEGDGSTSVDTASTKQSTSTEGEGFATDATWEERTWKELVRLKEDMFWARIGGIRALQG